MYGVSGKSWIAMGDPSAERPDQRMIWTSMRMSKTSSGKGCVLRSKRKYIPISLTSPDARQNRGRSKSAPESFTLEGSAGKDFRYTVQTLKKKVTGLRLSLLKK
jgi:phosphatidylglycerol lysyltransferase